MKLLAVLFMLLFAQSTKPIEKDLLGTIEVYQDENGTFTTTITSKVPYCYLIYIIDGTFVECDTSRMKVHFDSTFQQYQPLDDLPRKEKIKRI